MFIFFFKERKNTLSQTKNFDVMKNLQDTIQDLTNKIAASENLRAKIIEDLNMKDNQVKELQSSHTKLMAVSFHILYQAININK